MPFKNRRLKNRVQQWLKEGLITSPQGEAILQREQSSSHRPGREWGLLGFLLVAAFSTGTGIISLIAAGWHSIAPGVKLAGFFVILITTAAVALKLKKQGSTNSVYFEALLVLFMILCLAGQGLISQIYNITGEVYELLFFWSVMTFGLLPLSGLSLPGHLWMGGFYIALSTWGMSVWSQSFIYKITLLHPLFFVFLFLLFHNKTFTKPARFFGSLKHTVGEWVLLTGAIGLVVSHFPPPKDFQFFGGWELAVLVFLALPVGWAILQTPFKRVQKTLMGALLVMFFVFYILRGGVELNSLALMILSSVELSLAALLCASFKQREWFLLFVAALVIRILVFYIVLFKSLALTGLILILMGVIIFGIVHTLKKHKKRLSLWLQRLG